MVTTAELGRLSARVYSQYNAGSELEIDVRGFDRLAGVGPAENPATGFYAEAFSREGSNEVVVAFRGTDGIPNVDWVTNAGLFLDIGALQVRDAIEFVDEIIASGVDVDDLVFTGHSLGGALAALMAVRYQQPASVFSPAPYGRVLDDVVTDFGFLDPFLGTPIDGVIGRIRAAEFVDVYRINGEVLESTFQSDLAFYPADSIEEYDLRLDITPSFADERIDLHQILPHILAEETAGTDQDFAALTQDLPSLMRLLLDNDISGPLNPVAEERDFLVLFFNMLDTSGFYSAFYESMEKLFDDGAAAQDENVVEALLALGLQFARTSIDDGSPSGEIFGADENTVSINFDDIAAVGADEPQGVDVIRGFIDEQYSALGDAAPDTSSITSVVIQSNGNASLSSSGTDANDFILGGDGGDELRGGAGADVIAGGSGQDTLIGDDDTEADILDGGEDSAEDTFQAGDGDIIVNAGRNDVLIVDGEEISGRFVRNGSEGPYTYYEEADEGNGDPASGPAGGACPPEDEPPEEDAVWTITEDGVLTIVETGVTVRIEGFENRDLGIRLLEHQDDEEDESSDCGGGGSLASPLVLDLDNDGISLIERQDSRAYFDIDNDGFAESTGWIAPSEAFLALDRNGDGEIGDQSELFGYSNIIRADEFPDDAQSSGFAVLAELDLNADGVIDANDAAFSELLLWQDINSDGFSDAGELFTLSQLGVASIDVVNFDSSNPTRVGSNLITDFGTFTFDDGSTSTIADVFFAFDSHDTEFDARGVDVTPFADLPNLNGYGNYTDLDVAMALNPRLADLVSELSSMDPSNAAGFLNQFEEMVYVWFGVNDVDPVSRVSTAYGYSLQNIDARKLAVVEAMTGRPFIQETAIFARASAESDPRPVAGGVLTEVFRTFEARMATQFLAQSELGAQLFPELNYEANAFLRVVDGTDLTSVLDRFVQNAPSDFYNKISFWAGMTRILETVLDQFEDADPVSLINAVLAAEGLPGDYDLLRRASVGSDGIDVVSGQNSVIDQITPQLLDRVNDGANLLISGAGDDVMDGFSGADLYVWGRGQGNDIVREFAFGGGPFAAAGEDVIFFHDLTRDDVTVGLAGEFLKNAVTVTINDTGEVLTIEDARGLGDLPVFQFADGATFDARAILGPFQVSTAGDDLIQQRLALDPTSPLDGMEGDDRLIGEREATTYQFARGYDSDTIVDFGRPGDAEDQLTFLSGIVVNDLEFERRGINGKDLVISIAGTDDEIVIVDQYAGAAPVIERFFIEDGFGFGFPANLGADFALNQFLNSFNRDDLLGTVGDDDFFISFSDGGDFTATGLTGADTFNIDDFIFGAAGTVLISDRGRMGEVDVVDFGEDVSRLDVVFSSDAAGDIVITSVVTGASVTADGIDRFVFSDVTLSQSDALAAAIADQIASGQTEINGTSSDDIIVLGDEDHVVFAGSGDDTVDGGGGDDRLFGGSGNDSLTGSAGDDVLIGGSRDDVYIINPGDGFDVIADQFGGDDAIEFVGVNLGDVSFDVFFGDAGGFLNEVFLEITFSGTDDRVLILNPSDSGNRIEELRFAGGETVSFPSSGAIDGTAGADILFATSGNDVVAGGAGDDTIFAGQGDDVLFFAPGFGHDTVFEVDFNDFNVVQFGAGIAAGDVSLSLSGEFHSDLVISVNGGSDSITIVGQFNRENVNPLVSEISFNDGTLWDLAVIEGFFSNATTGNDVIVGSNRADTLNGGAGDDTLKGQNGGDTYEFGIGSGNDVIVEDGDGRRGFFIEDDGAIFGTGVTVEREIDTVRFGAGVTVNDLIVSAVGDNLSDLRIAIDGTSDSLTIENQLVPEVFLFGSAGGGEGEGEGGGDAQPTAFATGIEQFVFDDGSTLSREDLANLISSRDNAGDDTIETGDLGGVLDGGAGDDALNGGAGDDTYIFARGYGQETITDTGGSDALDIGSGITLGNLQLTRVGDNGQDLAIEVGGAEPLTVLINGQFGAGETPIDFITFANGESLTAADLRSLVLFNDSTESDDTIVGFVDDDIIRGLRGADTIQGLDGDDLIDGGGGRDTAVYRGSSVDYSVVQNANGTVTVIDLAPDVDGDDGEDTLINVEDILFLGDDVLAPVAPVNNAPVAAPDSFILDEDTALVLDPSSLLLNDTDPDNDTLSVSAVSNAVGGTVVLNAAGQIVFTPDADFTGEARFDYTIVDVGLDNPAGAGFGEASATVTVTVTPVNDAPDAADDRFQINEDEPVTLAAATLLSNDSDLDSETLSIVSVQDAVGGVAILNAEGDVEFTPTPNFSGEASFTYTIQDEEGATSTASVILSVAATPDAPVAVNDTLSIIEDVATNIDIAVFLANDVSIEGDPTIFTFDNFDNIRVELQADGSLNVIADPDFNGVGSFDYFLTDNSGLFSVGTVVVTVNPVDDAPRPQDDRFATVSNAPLEIAFADLLENDIEVDGEGIAFVDAIAGVNGSIVVDRDNEVITFTPDAGFEGQAGFEYSIQDASGNIASASVFVDVAQNNPPTGIFLSNASVDENSPGGAVVGELSATDPDLNETFTFRVSPGSNPAFVVSGSQLLVAPGAQLDFETLAVETVVLEVEDSAGNTFSQSFDIAINDVDEGGGPGVTETISFARVSDRNSVAFADGIVDPDTEVLDPVNHIQDRRLIAITGDGDLALESGELGYVLSSVGNGNRVTTLPVDNGAEDPVQITAYGRLNNNTRGDLTDKVRFSESVGFGLDNGPNGEPEARELDAGDALDFIIVGDGLNGRTLSDVSFVLNTRGDPGAATLALDIDGEILAGGPGAWTTGALVEIGGLVDGDAVTIDLAGRDILINGVSAAGDFSALFDAFEAAGAENITIGSSVGGGAGFALKDLVLNVEQAAPVAATAASAPNDPITAGGSTPSQSESLNAWALDDFEMFVRRDAFRWDRDAEWGGFERAREVLDFRGLDALDVRAFTQSVPVQAASPARDEADMRAFAVSDGFDLSGFVGRGADGPWSAKTAEIPLEWAREDISWASNGSVFRASTEWLDRPEFGEAFHDRRAMLWQLDDAYAML